MSSPVVARGNVTRQANKKLRRQRIHDIAKTLIARAGNDIEIVFTGLSKGEKLHEKLIADSDTGMHQVHPSITHVSVDPLPLRYADTPFFTDLTEQSIWSNHTRNENLSPDDAQS